jgi:DNA-binding CsgD family transcriptional regulator/GAF domain-containing protein
MARLPQSDARAVLRAFTAMVLAADDPEARARAGVRELPDLVGSDLTTLSVCDLATGRRRVVGAAGEKLSPDDIACFDRYFFVHPLVRYHATHHEGATHRISDSQPGNAFRRTPLYGEYYRRIGVEHAVAVPLHVDGRTLVSFVLNRTGRDFSDRECDRLEALRRPLAALYRNAAGLAAARTTAARYRQWVHAAGWAELALDAELCLRTASRRGLVLLAAASHGGVARVGAALPPPLDGWLRESARAGGAAAWTELPAGRGTVGVRVLRDPDGDGWLVYLREEAPDAPVPEPLPLTPRERDVLRWVAAGKSDGQIGAILGASPRTVQKHLEHIYAKLGVESRTAAAMRYVRGGGTA